MRGCSLLGAFPKELLFQDLLLTPGDGMLQQLCSFNSFRLFLTAQTSVPASKAQTSVPASKRDCQLQKEGKNKHGVYSGSALSVFSALLKHAQPLEERSPKAHSL